MVHRRPRARIDVSRFHAWICYECEVSKINQRLKHDFSISPNRNRHLWRIDLKVHRDLFESSSCGFLCASKLDGCFILQRCQISLGHFRRAEEASNLFYDLVLKRDVYWSDMYIDARIKLVF